MGAIALLSTGSALVGSPWFKGAALVAAAAAGAALTHRLDEGRYANERLKAEQQHSKDLQAQRDGLVADIEHERKTNAEVAAALQSEKDGRDADRSDYEKKLAEVSRDTLIVYVDRPVDRPVERPVPDEAGPAGAVTNGGVVPNDGRDTREPPRAALSSVACGLWNDALRGALLEAERAGWPAGDDPCTGAVEIDDALRNLRATAELLGQCRAREQQAHAFYRKEGLTP